jgi:hypothetical protein
MSDQRHNVRKLNTMIAKENELRKETKRSEQFSCSSLQYALIVDAARVTMKKIGEEIVVIHQQRNDLIAKIDKELDGEGQYID